jgi:hypothetical protein
LSISKKTLDKISNIIEVGYYRVPVVSPWEDVTAEIAKVLDEDAPEGPYGLPSSLMLDLAADAVEDAAEAVALDSGADIVDRHSASAWLWNYSQKLRNLKND